MEMNWVMLIAGLIICFGGIYIRKFVSGVLGLAWGAVVSLLIMVISAYSGGQIRYADETTVVLIAIISALTVGILSAVFDRVAAAVNVFCNCAMFVVVLVFFSGESRESLQVMIIVGLLLSAVVAGVAYAFHNIAYAIVTALSGGNLAAMAIVGLLSENSFDRVLNAIFLYSDEEALGMVSIITVVLGVLGFLVQMRRVKILKGRGKKKEKTIADTVAEKAQSQQVYSDDIIVPTPEFQDDLPVPLENLPATDDIEIPAPQPASGRVSICPRCQSIHQKVAAYCPACGERMTVVCAQCGNEVKEDGKFCGHCGNRI